MQQDSFVIGVDYGSDSVRTIIANAANGQEVASAVFHYPRWKDGLYCNPSLNQFRQHPLDYIEGLEDTIKLTIRFRFTLMKHGADEFEPARESEQVCHLKKSKYLMPS